MNKGDVFVRAPTEEKVQALSYVSSRYHFIICLRCTIDDMELSRTVYRIYRMTQDGGMVFL